MAKFASQNKPRYAAQAKFDKIATLKAENTVSSRKALKAMQDQYHDTDSKGFGCDLWLPNGPSRRVKSGEAKYKRTLKAWTDKQTQGFGQQFN